MHLGGDKMGILTIELGPIKWVRKACQQVSWQNHPNFGNILCSKNNLAEPILFYFKYLGL